MLSLSYTNNRPSHTYNRSKHSKAYKLDDVIGCYLYTLKGEDLRVALVLKQKLYFVSSQKKNRVNKIKIW